VLFFDANGLTNYLGWEELQRLKAAAKTGPARMAISAAAAAS
jgi:hypothetical protein